jgi:fermentation-respiration switch protein FrsA (DUF1100 family)
MGKRQHTCRGKAAMALTGLICVCAMASSCASDYFYSVAVARNQKHFFDDKKDPRREANAKARALAKQWYDETPREDLSLTSRDGISLKAYYYQAAAPSNKLAILAHGYTSSGEGMGGYAKYYHDVLGFNVLLPDARGHGRSGGTYIGFGWPDRLDYIDWINLMVQRLGPDCEISLHGVSMGGATVLMVSGEQLPSQVKAIVSDCAYTSAEAELSYQITRTYHLPAKPIVPDTSALTKRRVGYSFEEASALDQVRKARVPILFIHGDADTFVPTAMVYELYKACASPKEIFIVPGAGHGLSSSIDPEGYKKAVREFILKYL